VNSRAIAENRWFSRFREVMKSSASKYFAEFYAYKIAQRRVVPPKVRVSIAP
jgi:hypothetical protein